MAVSTQRKLSSTTDMFKDALANKYSVGAFNVNNMELLQAIAEAAEELRSPLILQVSAGARKYANQTYLIKLVEEGCLSYVWSKGIKHFPL